MKSIFLSLCLFTSLSLSSQVNPQIFYSSSKIIIGVATPNDTIKLSTTKDFKVKYKTIANKVGDFEIKFTSPLKVDDTIIVWSVNSDNVNSQKIIIKIEDDKSIIDAFSNKSLLKNILTNKLAANQTIDYKTTIWNTNFSIPLARFNFSKQNDEKIGDLILFNSIGAGFGISWGELSETRNAEGELINQEFVNTFGVHLGFLFSAGTGDDTKNVFAPTLNFSILDFQIGLGYELGTITENQKRTFLTLSYAIPLYKLKKGGFWIWKNSRPINSPLDSRQGK